MNQLRRTGIIIDLKAMIVAAAACGSMLLCRQMGWTADFPLALIATAVIFPSSSRSAAPTSGARRSWHTTA